MSTKQIEELQEDKKNLYKIVDKLEQRITRLENIEEALNPLGKYKLVEPTQMELPLEEPEDSKIDTLLQLENEMSLGK
jgi:hypothetical protein|tara:strand:- start:129 stop:362 length:234 start_codon:yes stop_codon:yes gene_type:complete